VATRLQLEGGDLAALLAQVSEDLGPSARVIRAERVRTGGVAGFFAREHFELTVEVPDAPLPRPRASRYARPAAGGPPSALSGLDALLGAADAADDDGRPRPAHEPPAISTGGSAFADVLAQVQALAAERRAPAAAVGVVDEPAASTPPPAAPPVVVRPEPPASFDLATRLASVGVPDELLRHGPRSLADVVGALPAAPPPARTPGAVTVVVGSAVDADRTAALLADRLGIAPESVVSAGTATARAGAPGPRGRSRTRPADAETAQAWRATAGSAAHPWVVALAVGEGREELGAAADLLAALQGDAVWAVVDARTKTPDARAWLGRLGRVDALAVRGMFDTTQPGAVLDLGVPVAWFDGIPATPAAWASALDTALDGAGGWAGRA